MIKKLAFGGALGFPLAAAVLYGAWRLSQPVQIDAVHRDGSYSNVLVRHFPLTDRGRIDWWEQNKAWLKNGYGIPEPEADGSFVVLFWAWDGVYRVDRGIDQDSDLRCFDDLPPGQANCIVKSDIPLEVSRSRDGGLIFYIGRDRRSIYSQTEEGGELKRRWDMERARERAMEWSREQSRERWKARMEGREQEWEEESRRKWLEEVRSQQEQQLAR
ncbi:DUF943 family protein [Metapseudomonas boanensis]|uniref:DUF943 family protein n=1 Tax=Metapseudomonas boanensis TaxID=2822138 RepID=A0ABS5XL73_9GAMM|nr:DUF943 family protein [Pseudomonas boanensis]MBT8767886.1 DUF943 family protein [Pseudomonas boanensis]